MATAIQNIRPLNETERGAIKEALEAYIATHSEKQAWSHKIILNEMLYELMWANYSKEPAASEAGQ